jgi:hypothetical protein
VAIANDVPEQICSIYAAGSPTDKQIQRLLNMWKCINSPKTAEKKVASGMFTQKLIDSYTGLNFEEVLTSWVA